MKKTEYKPARYPRLHPGEDIEIIQCSIARYNGRFGRVQEVSSNGTTYGTWGAAPINFLKDRFRVLKDED